MTYWTPNRENRRASKGASQTNGRGARGSVSPALSVPRKMRASKPTQRVTPNPSTRTSMRGRLVSKLLTMEEIAETHPTSKPQKRRRSKAASRATGIGTRDRPVSMSVNGDSGRRHHGGALPKFHALKAVAEALDVSPRTVRRWIANGDLIVHRVHGVIRIGEGDLRAFLALHRED
jgi:hypothetical protein